MIRWAIPMSMSASTMDEVGVKSDRSVLERYSRMPGQISITARMFCARARASMTLRWPKLFKMLMRMAINTVAPQTLLTQMAVVHSGARRKGRIQDKLSGVIIARAQRLRARNAVESRAAWVGKNPRKHLPQERPWARTNFSGVVEVE